jgi:hypothetical protein
VLDQAIAQRSRAKGAELSALQPRNPSRSRALAFALTLEHVERRIRERLDALGPAARAELLHVLMLPDFERADRIGEFWGYPESRTLSRGGG